MDRASTHTASGLDWARKRMETRHTDTGKLVPGGLGSGETAEPRKFRRFVTWSSMWWCFCIQIIKEAAFMVHSWTEETGSASLCKSIPCRKAGSRL